MDIVGNYQLYIPLKKSIYFIKDTIDTLRLKEEDTIVKNKDQKTMDLSKNWLQIEGAIYQTKKLLNSKNIDYKIIINSERQKNIDKLSQILNAHFIQFLNLNTLQKENKLVLPSFSCDRHWSDEAHKNLARFMYESKFLDR